MTRGGGRRPLRIAIVGGGITGLSAAYHLSRLGTEKDIPVEITVFEADTRLGGKVRSEHVEGLLLEGGPDSFLVRKPWMKALCQRVGLDDRLVSLGEGESRTYVRHDGRLRPIPPGLGMGMPRDWRSVLGTDLFSWRGKLRLALEPFIPTRRATDDESVASFARRRMGREVATRLVEPLLSAIYAGDPQKLSLQAAFPVFGDMERRYGSLWAAMRAAGRKESGDRSGKAPGQAGASAGAPPVFQTLREGLESLVGPLRSQTRAVRFLTGRAVVQVDMDVPEDGAGPADEGRQGDGQECGRQFTLHCGDGSSETFDRVVVTVPAPAAAGILGDVSPEAAAELETIEYTSVVSVFLAYRRADVSHPLDGTGYLPSGEDRQGGVGACTWVSSKWPHCVGRDRVLLRCHIGARAGVDPTLLPEPELIALARWEVGGVLGVTATPLLSRVFRWPAAFPQYGLGHRDRVDAIERALPPGILVAGAAYRGVGLPDCVRQGCEAAERALA